jgi:hypothetical protein
MKRLIILAAFALAPTMAGSALAMDVDDVIALLDGGVGEEVILDQVAAENAQFALSTEDILDLRDAGASNDLIQQLILTGGKRSSSDDWTSRYYGPSVRVRLYYDPFGYNWYAWPYSFSYYYPFDWWDCGFYYAGWWNHRWWVGRPWHNYYWNHYHWDHWASNQGGRHVWGRTESGGRATFDRASSGTRGAARVRSSRASPTLRTAPSPDSQNRHAYGRGRDRGTGTGRSSVTPPGRSPRTARSSPPAQASPRSAPSQGGQSAPPRTNRSGDRSGWRR